MPPINPLWNLTRKTLAFLLATLFSLALALALFASALTGVLADEQNLLKLAAETHLAERSRPLVANLLVTFAASATSPAGAEQSADFAKSMPVQAWQSVADYLIPASYMEENLQRLLGQVLAWLDDPQAGLPEMQLDLAPVRQALEGPSGVQAMLPLLQNAPDCPAGDTQVTYFGDGVVSCLPPGYNLSYFAGRVAGLIAESTPAQIRLNDYLAAPLLANLEKTRQGLWALRSAATFGQRLSLLLLALYALLYSSGLLRLLRALPRPLYAAAILSLLLIAALNGLLAWGLDLLALSTLPALNAGLQLLLTDLIKSLGSQVSSAWLRGALLTLAAAVLLHLLGYILERFTLRRMSQVIPPPGPSRQVRKQFR